MFNGGGNDLVSLHEVAHTVGDYVAAALLSWAGLVIRQHRNWKNNVEKRLRVLEAFRQDYDTERRVRREIREEGGD